MNKIHLMPLSLASSKVLCTRVAPLVVILVLVLFPFGWLGYVWYPVGLLLSQVFPTEHARAIGHTLMFLSVGLALLVSFPILRLRPVFYLGVMGVLSLGQEAFQLVYKQRAPGFGELRDLKIDLLAILLALALVKLWGWRKHVV